MSVLLAATAALLFSAGTYLVLQRRLSRIIIGIGLLGNGANLVILLSAGRAGDPGFLGEVHTDYLDPLPQALILTAIVITFGVIALLLALAYRSWQLTADDELEDDVEDRRVARSAEADTDVRDELIATEARRLEEAQ